MGEKVRFGGGPTLVTLASSEIMPNAAEVHHSDVNDAGKRTKGNGMRTFQEAGVVRWTPARKAFVLAAASAVALILIQHARDFVVS